MKTYETLQTYCQQISANHQLMASSIVIDTDTTTDTAYADQENPWDEEWED